jgi:rare lipoprotein A (peptidoglycan hydrolase)
MSRGEFEAARRRASRLLVLVAVGWTMAGCAAGTTKFADAPTRRSAEANTVSLAHARPNPWRKVRTVRRPRSMPTGLEGYASYYTEGTRVATGARYRPGGLTAAHRSLPFGTRVRVRDLATGRSVVVVINDRGPFVRGRVLDLSLGAARALGIESRGVSRIHADVL